MPEYRAQITATGLLRARWSASPPGDASGFVHRVVAGIPCDLQYFAVEIDRIVPPGREATYIIISAHHPRLPDATLAEAADALHRAEPGVIVGFTRDVSVGRVLAECNATGASEVSAIAFATVQVVAGWDESEAIDVALHGMTASVRMTRVADTWRGVVLSRTPAENGMSHDELAMCRWPDLPPRYATALRAALTFVFERFEPQSVVAAGSVVRGEGDRSSDLDVFVVHERPYKQRLQRWFGDVPVEIFVNPPRAIRAYFASEHERGRPSTAHMIATGFPVFGGQALDALRAEAADWLKKRATLTPDEDTFARYTAATLLEDGEDVVERDPAMASALLGEAVMAMLRYYLRAERGVVPGNKSLLLEVERNDQEAARSARRFFAASTVEERQLAARALADRTIRAQGFFEWDSERIPVPDD